MIDLFDELVSTAWLDEAIADAGNIADEHPAAI